MKINHHELFYCSFIHNLNVAIEFHRTNTNDPHGISNAVMAALIEVKAAAWKAHEIGPYIAPVRKARKKGGMR